MSDPSPIETRTGPLADVRYMGSTITGAAYASTPEAAIAYALQICADIDMTATLDVLGVWDHGPSHGEHRYAQSFRGERSTA